MRRRTLLSAAPVLLPLALLAAAPPTAADGPSTPGTGFSGAWTLAASKDDVAAKARKGLWDIASGMPGDSKSGGFDIPLEVMTDAHRLVVADDGATMSVVYPSGRKRTFVTDERPRYVEDGDSPATVTARRKATTVSVISEWFRGYKLRETWELRADPRRLVVTGKLSGRASQSYARTYEPGPSVEPTPVPTPAPEGVAAAAGPATPGTAAGEPPAFVDRLAECSARPPRSAREDDLRGWVKVSQEAAAKTAAASVAPRTATDVISSDAEVLEGCLVWPFTLRMPGLRGVQEIFVDAGDGKVVRSEFVPAETPAPAP